MRGFFYAFFVFFLVLPASLQFTHRTPLLGVARTRQGLRTTSSLFSSSNLNELQTLLSGAVKTEDYALAASLRDRINVVLENDASSNVPKDWKSLNIEPWLEKRLTDLDFVFPTISQSRFLTNNDSDVNNNPGAASGIRILSSPPGSGKTVAYSSRILSLVSASLFSRGEHRLRVARDRFDDNNDDMTGGSNANFNNEIAAVSEASSPQVSGGKLNPNVGGSMLSSLSAFDETKLSLELASLRKVLGPPLVLVVVPTFALGSQTALSLFELVGGNLRRDFVPGDNRNMFGYSGPRGVRISCVLNEEEARMGMSTGTDIAIVRGDLLSGVISRGEIDPKELKGVVVDEMDEVLEALSNVEEDQGEKKDNITGRGKLREEGVEALRSVLDRGEGKERVIVGATVEEKVMEELVSVGILNDDETLIWTKKEGGKTTEKKNNDKESNASLGTDGLVHRRCKTDKTTALLALCRLLRADLSAWSSTPESVGVVRPPRPRFIVFFPTELKAKLGTGALRASLWGDFRLCALLPEIGGNPLLAVEQFKYNETDLLVTTPEAARGLDFPGVTGVYNLVDDEHSVDDKEYLHQAGRVGRVGQIGAEQGGNGGVVTTIFEDSERGVQITENLSKMGNFDWIDLAFPRDIEMADIEKVVEGDFDVELFRRMLDDYANLM